METKFIPTNPEELAGFDSILKEFNTINDYRLCFYRQLYGQNMTYM